MEPAGVGIKVSDGQTPPHIGTVEALDVLKGAYVRWHKGYATWVPWNKLKLVREENEKVY